MTSFTPTEDDKKLSEILSGLTPDEYAHVLFVHFNTNSRPELVDYANTLIDNQPGLKPEIFGMAGRYFLEHEEGFLKSVTTEVRRIHSSFPEQDFVALGKCLNFCDVGTPITAVLEKEEDDVIEESVGEFNIKAFLLAGPKWSVAEFIHDSVTGLFENDREEDLIPIISPGYEMTRFLTEPESLSYINNGKAEEIEHASDEIFENSDEDNLGRLVWSISSEQVMNACKIVLAERPDVMAFFESNLLKNENQREAYQSLIQHLKASPDNGIGMEM